MPAGIFGRDHLMAWNSAEIVIPSDCLCAARASRARASTNTLRPYERKRLEIDSLIFKV